MMGRNAMRETVLYYTPEQMPHAARLKGVLVQMGIRIRNVASEQVTDTVGSLLGIPGAGQEAEGTTQPDALPVLTQEMLVLYNFSGKRLDELLFNLRRAGVPKTALKAVVTEHNINWTFYHLYEEIREEHERMRFQIVKPF